MSITDFLLARIAEDETVARAAVSNVWPDEWENPTQGANYYAADIAFWNRHDPARVLAECEAKRAIVELADDATSLDMSVDNEFRVGFRDEAVEPYCGDSILYALAAVYADHPDYSPEWKVGA